MYVRTYVCMYVRTCVNSMCSYNACNFAYNMLHKLFSYIRAYIASMCVSAQYVRMYVFVHTYVHTHVRTPTYVGWSVHWHGSPGVGGPSSCGCWLCQVHLAEDWGDTAFPVLCFCTQLGIVSCLWGTYTRTCMYVHVHLCIVLFSGWGGWLACRNTTQWAGQSLGFSLPTRTDMCIEDSCTVCCTDNLRTCQYSSVLYSQVIVVGTLVNGCTGAYVNVWDYKVWIFSSCSLLTLWSLPCCALPRPTTCSSLHPVSICPATCSQAWQRKRQYRWVCTRTYVHAGVLLHSDPHALGTGRWMLLTVSVVCVDMYVHTYVRTYTCCTVCVFPVQILNHSVSNVEFEWMGMESVEGANISIEPTAGSVGVSPSTASDQSIHMYIYGITCIRTYITQSLCCLHCTFCNSSLPSSTEFYSTIEHRSFTLACVHVSIFLLQYLP